MFSVVIICHRHAFLVYFSICSEVMIMYPKLNPTTQETRKITLIGIRMSRKSSYLSQGKKIRAQRILAFPPLNKIFFIQDSAPNLPNRQYHRGLFHERFHFQYFFQDQRYPDHHRANLHPDFPLQVLPMARQ